MSQLPLDLGHRPALGRGSFLSGPSNATALAMIDRWPDWPDGKLVLTGPEGAGKTHLVHIWAERSGAAIQPADAPGDGDLAPGTMAVAVEDADRIAGRRQPEERLFHLHNQLRERGGFLLVTGRTPPARWSFQLPDLASRLCAAVAVEVDPPDDTLLEGVLVKLFADRHIRVGPRLVPYLARRIDRSLAEAARVVDALDAAGLAAARPIGIDLAREVLDLRD